MGQRGRRFAQTEVDLISRMQLFPLEIERKIT